MFEAIVGLFLTAALFYAAFGFVFAIPFVLCWSGRIDSAAKSGSWGFRLAILPGTIALWPLMALKTLQAFRQRYLPPNPERPVSPVMQRRIHGAASVALAGVLPVICAAALLSRPREHFSIATQLQPAPLPDVIAFARSLPQSLPIRATLRTDGERDQVQLAVSRSLDESVVALYWSREAETGSISKDAIFLGSVWGPSRLLFDLPRENHTVPGVLTFLSLAGEQRVIGMLPLNPE
jgi:hypothetical protein